MSKILGCLIICLLFSGLSAHALDLDVPRLNAAASEFAQKYKEEGGVRVIGSEAKVALTNLGREMGRILILIDSKENVLSAAASAELAARILKEASAEARKFKPADRILETTLKAVQLEALKTIEDRQRILTMILEGSDPHKELHFDFYSDAHYYGIGKAVLPTGRTPDLHKRISHILQLNGCENLLFPGKPMVRGRRNIYI